LRGEVKTAFDAGSASAAPDARGLGEKYRDEQSEKNTEYQQEPLLMPDAPECRG
jgi:hypothetical protein